MRHRAWAAHPPNKEALSLSFSLLPAAPHLNKLQGWRPRTHIFRGGGWGKGGGVVVRKDRRAERPAMSRAMRGRALPYQCHARLYVNSLAHPGPRPDGQIRNKKRLHTTPAPQLAVPKNTRLFLCPLPAGWERRRNAG